MEPGIIVLSIIKGITVLLGIVFLAFTWRAWRRHHNPAMRYLFVAVLLLTVGLLAEGFVFQVLGGGMIAAHVTEAVFALLGFAVLVYSVLVPRRKRERVEE